MKLNSQKELVELIRVLSSFGYSTTFCDFEYEMKLHGFNKHIHMYECKVLHVKVMEEDNTNDNVYVCFLDTSNKKTFQITLEKRK